MPTRVLIDEFALSLGEVAERVGRSKPSVSNRMRLLDLPDDVLGMVERGELTEGHARAVSPCPTRKAAAGSRARSCKTRAVRPRGRAARPAGPAPAEAADAVAGRSGAGDARAHRGRAAHGLPVRVDPRPASSSRSPTSTSSPSSPRRSNGIGPAA